MTPREKKRNKKKREYIDIKNNKKSSEDKIYNYLLTITYDGSFYGGYAKQQFDNTIEEKLNNVIDSYLNDHVKLISSSRTDAKVHAMDQKVMFKFKKKIAHEKFLNYVNETLPNSIEILSIENVDIDFHCRYDVKDKTYIYKLHNKKNIFLNNYSYFWNNNNIDVNLINNMCKQFIGEKDFKIFSSSKRDTEQTIRTINSFTFRQIDKNNFVFVINGNGFLYNMIRIIISSIIEWITKSYEPSYVKKIIDQQLSKEVASKNSANGLYLKEINY